jgi:flavin-dependent dehydrogenase
MHDIIIIGGGLAGLTAALHLSKAGCSVLVIEKKSYPQHKVCGEYVSDEVLNYLQSLGADIKSIQPRHVDRFRLYAPSGTFIEAPLPLGGFGMRRYTFDHHLYEKALAGGVDFWLSTKVEQVHFQEDYFEVKAQRKEPVRAQVVLGSFGKRSTLDKALHRPFFRKPADYLGVKFYLKTDFPSNLVTLYNFSGGYGGAVEVEDGTVDIAYLTRHDQVKACGGLQAFEEKVIWKNPAFKTLLTEAERLKPTLTISNISFRPKKQIQDHILMLGDAAGMIPPLAGNGMAMAIHAGKLASEVATPLFAEKDQSVRDGEAVPAGLEPAFCLPPVLGAAPASIHGQAGLVGVFGTGLAENAVSVTGYCTADAWKRDRAIVFQKRTFSDKSGHPLGGYLILG